ncbi:hypothetical protein LJC14_06120 [Treponema sp. OttesenSCG-928-L16]|nr:hypothetical protein [Treponema sp. OttesenSCG-928-L16]
MKRILFYILCVSLFFFSCSGTPEAVPEETAVPGDSFEEDLRPLPEEEGSLAEQAAAEDDDDPYFDPASVSQELYDTTKSDVQELIQNLNQIIRARDYDAWVSYLGADYFTAISSPEYLNRISESARLKAQNIALKTPQDYFIHVVVPSRANDRVDDIEFISKKRVKAYTITPSGQRLRLYNLEDTNAGWKIIN